MSEKVVNTGGGGISFFGMLAVLFIGLKLTNYIAWSWWWVLSPLWGPASIALVVCVILLIGIAVLTLFDWLLNRRK